MGLSVIFYYIEDKVDNAVLENSKNFIIWKIKPSQKITLVKDKTFTTQGEKNADLLNIFFSNAVKNLKIPKFSNTNPLAERPSDPTLKAISKCKNHPSTVAIRKANNSFHFQFNEVSAEKVYTEIRKLSPRKSTQSTDIPIRVLQDNANIFNDYICGFSNECIRKSTFRTILKVANITSDFKKG